MKYELPVLPYETGALEPVIGKQTIELHYGKHLQTYITNLNNLIAGTKFEDADLVTIVKESDGPLFNNAGQTLNHNIYSLSFSPNLISLWAPRAEFNPERVMMPLLTSTIPSGSPVSAACTMASCTCLGVA